MNTLDVAKKLNGSQFPFRLSQEAEKELKENGLIIVCGDSDDIVSFHGAIRDEDNLYEGGTSLISKKGLVLPKDQVDFDDEEEVRSWLDKKETSKEIHSLWCKNEYDWSFKTDIPHESFDILEGEEKFCRAIVIDINDI